MNTKMAKNNRTKGANEERRIAKLYREIGFKDASRNLAQYQKTDGRDLSGVDGFCIQIKTGKQVVVRKGLMEAVEAAKPGEIPVLHFRDHGQSLAYVLIKESDWIKMIQRSQSG